MSITISIGRRNEHTDANDKLEIFHYLFLLFWVMKPFYLWSSGRMQISDFLFVLSFVFWLFNNRGRILAEKKDLLYFYFVVLTFVVNSLHSLLNSDSVFILSSIYYLYNLLMVLAINSYKSNDSFLKNLLLVSRVNILVQLLVLVLGTGRFFYNSSRYMGTFNDPNQFAFSMFTSFLLVYMLTGYFRQNAVNRKRSPVLLLYAITWYFVFRSGSTGMLLGMTSFAIFTAIAYLTRDNSRTLIVLRTVAIAFVIITLFYVLVVGFPTGTFELNSDLMYRLELKLDQADSNGLVALLEERGIDKLYNYPEYVFIGAGDGLYGRFVDSAFEVHSTLPGALFYYGIIPFALLCVWLWTTLRGTSKMLVPVFAALFMESLTLANQRQPVFWMLIVLCGLPQVKNSIGERRRNVRYL